MARGAAPPTHERDRRASIDRSGARTAEDTEQVAENFQNKLCDILVASVDSIEAGDSANNNNNNSNNSSSSNNNGGGRGGGGGGDGIAAKREVLLAASGILVSIVRWRSN